MRISDWSSDVCSSDLSIAVTKTRRNTGRRDRLPRAIGAHSTVPVAITPVIQALPVKEITPHHDIDPETIVPVRSHVRWRRITRMALLGSWSPGCRWRLYRRG